MIKNCFMTDQPDFKKEIKYKNEKIATIHALTKKDRIILEDIMKKRIEDGKIVTDMNFQKFQIKRMYLSLSGYGCGWEFEAEMNEDNIAILKDEYFDIIDKEIQKINEIGSGIEKN